MTSNSERIRCRNDLDMFATLSEHPEVQKANEAIARHEETTPSGIRRRLLATSVRLSPRMAPYVHRMADDCAERLQIGIPHELYAYAGPQFNAACFKPEDDRVCVMFSSGLLEAFEGTELKFVVGHELGHHVYRHHDIPIGLLLRGREKPDPRLALDLFSWSRYAEISADRAGAFCAQDINGVSRALFKLASGLSGRTIRFELDDFLAQVDAMQVEDDELGHGASTEDWFSTHPFSPLRVKALQLYDRSDLARDGGYDVGELETRIQGLMALMEPSYLDGRTTTTESMRRLLFAGGLLVAHADGEVDANEKEAFEKFFGDGALTDELNVAALHDDLDRRIRRVRELATTAQRIQVLRDICLIARAEGKTSDAERVILERVARGLEIAEAHVIQALDCEYELD